MSADVEEIAGGLRAIVEHALVIWTGKGSELATWHVRGERSVGFEDGAILVAFAKAADEAARAFEQQLRRSVEVSTWLRERGVELAPLEPASAPAPPDPATTLIRPERAGFVAFLDAGVARSSGPDTELYGFAVRAGASSRWLLLQLRFERSRMGFEDPAHTTWSDSTLDVTTLGADLGAVMRASRDLEVRFGVGAHSHAAKVRMTYYPVTLEKRVSAGSVFGGLQYAASVGSRGIRGRAGVEVRREFGPTLRFDGFWRSFPVETTISAFLGAELPFHR